MAKAQPKKTEEKKESPMTTIQMSRELRAAIDKLPGDTAEDKIRRLMIIKEVVEAPEKDKVHLIVDKISYEKLVAWQPTVHLREILVSAKVS